MLISARFTFAFATACSGLIVACALSPIVAPAVRFVLSESPAPVLLFYCAAACGAGVAGALFYGGFGRPGSLGGLLGLCSAFLTTGLGAAMGAVIAVLLALPVGMDTPGGFIASSANLGFATLFSGVVHIWPAGIWLVCMATLHEFAKRLRAGQMRSARARFS